MEGPVLIPNSHNITGKPLRANQDADHYVLASSTSAMNASAPLACYLATKQAI